jgi:pyrimidine operon attenuation protein/uracil phosphoribosyltransferase
MRVALDPDGVQRGLRRVAGEIVERHPGATNLVVVGVRRGGVAVAREVVRWIRELEGREVPVGTVDITLYRDDAATALPNPRIGASSMPCPLDGKVVVLCDDVVFTGRTVRAALDAVLDYGRPERIELLAVVDRGGRELPVQPDYAVKTLEVGRDERVDVVEEGGALSVVIQPMGAPSAPPPAPPRSPGTP